MLFQSGGISVRDDKGLTDFDVEVSDGVNWVTLNDHVNYRVGVEGLGLHAQTRRKITTTSPYYDGTFVVHSTLENVEENITVQVFGASQNQVTENLLYLIELFSQDAYNVRLRLDDHLETWACQPADYSIDRTHVYAHNAMALVKLVVSRFPTPSYEVIL